MKKILKKNTMSQILGGKIVNTKGTVTTTCGDQTCTTTQTDSFDDKNGDGIRNENESGTSTVTTVCH